jgi:hypothetical protein
VFLMSPEVVMPMSCSLCEPESRADGALAAHELNQLINAVAEAPANAVAQPRDSPISSNSTAYLARTNHLRACLSNSRNCAGDSPPSGLGSYRRARGRGMCRPCSDQSCCFAYFEDYPAPHLLCNNMFSQHREGNQAVGQPHRLC